MKAKDTVMSRKGKQRLIVERSHQQTVGETQEDMLLKAQAIATWEAAEQATLKRVGEWFDKDEPADFGKFMESLRQGQLNDKT
jgi:hypothetical protein